MTIDERLEKLTERHEALAQTMELMAAENRDRDERWDKRMEKTEQHMTDVMEGIARLLHVAEIHEQRLERLEH
jgi:polynucleotide 5'-kinase involved in rRNA processing